ncbi:GT-D fold domain-containing glycosyltransferase [uncultured Paenibacillus sp.]|uniref:GT-D fold domain-containing glycosyltransferase n=1 Tax=uncultured Paenibacillus sp. TaxID=227322 RepID=UPI0015ACBA4C|nr:GT-D fold domain-containing glycosyltransferase [uncultured Paenibacillus sp.]
MQQIYLETQDLLKRIEDAAENRKPFSLVRIGDGENLVMAQHHVWPLSKVLQERWAMKANRGEKGLTLPNLPLRNAVVSSVKRATVVGILPAGDASINAPDYLKRPLTDQIFSYYHIEPAMICHAGVNRELARMEEFWSLLSGRRIIVITREAQKIKERLEKEPYMQNIVHALTFSQWQDYRHTLKWMTTHKNSFDVALISCGVNAVVLAERIAALTGKVALDFGKANNIILKGRPN